MQGGGQVSRFGQTEGRRGENFKGSRQSSGGFQLENGRGIISESFIFLTETRTEKGERQGGRRCGRASIFMADEQPIVEQGGTGGKIRSGEQGRRGTLEQIGHQSLQKPYHVTIKRGCPKGAGKGEGEGPARPNQNSR